MSGKIGEDHYDVGRFVVRGLHELGNAVVFPDSNIPVRDYSGLYGSKESPGVELNENLQQKADMEKEYEEAKFVRDMNDVDLDPEPDLDP